MCGISGILNFSNRKIDNRKIIKNLITAQHARGPDNNNYWVSEDDRITLGHNRLSIIDLSLNANQPFISNDKNFIISFNGEIYNFLELKKELSEKNIFFKTNSDTEVIIEAYKYWGLNFVKHLRGMFAFCIFDKIKKKIIIARDPFGIKPLYYTIYNGVLYFASEIKALLKIKDIPFNLSKAGTTCFYIWGHIQEPFTIYEEIKSLKRGLTKIIDINGNQKDMEYASIKETILNTESKNIKDNFEINAIVKNELDKSVKHHFISDVPITLLLSSGIDSNVLLASASSQKIPNFDALTLDFSPKFKNSEINISDKSAKINNTKHEVRKFLDSEILKSANLFFSKMDSPTSDGLNNYLVSKEVKRNKRKVMISGVGADEIFQGYPSFTRIPKIFKIFKYFPELSFKNGSLIFKLMDKIKINTKFANLLKYSGTFEEIFFLQRSRFMPEELEFLSDKNKLYEGLEELNIFENLKKDIKDFKNDKLLIMYLEIKYYLCSRLLRDSDWASMSNSVEMRTPFVDWSFFKNILPIIKSDFKFGKNILIDIYSENLPKELYQRKKTGFDIPYKKYFSLLSKKKGMFKSPQKNWTQLSINKYFDYNHL